MFYEVSEDLKFLIEIMSDSFLSKLELAKGLKEAIATATGIANEYKAYIAKEGKIRGQERARMIENLDRFFTLLIILREKLQESKIRKHFSDKEFLYKVPIRVKGNKYVGYGTLQKKDVAAKYTFNSGYETLILWKLKGLLIYCYRTLNGQEIQEDNLQDMYLMFDDLFYNILVMRYKLRNLLIDR